MFIFSEQILALVLSGIVMYLSLVGICTWILHCLSQSGSYTLPTDVQDDSVSSSDPSIDCGVTYNPRYDTVKLHQWAKDLQTSDPEFSQQSSYHSPYSSMSSSVYLDVSLTGDNPPAKNSFIMPEDSPELELPPVAIMMNPLGPMSRARARSSQNILG
jgi:hypothetical protein